MTSSLASLVRLGLPLLLASCATPTTESADAPIFGLGDEDAEVGEAESLAWDEMARVQADLGLRDLDDLMVQRVRIDDLNMAHTRFQQLYNGLPVFGGEAIVHLHPNGAVRGMTNNLVTSVQVDTTPDYTGEEAFDIALVEADLDELHLTQAPTVDLYVLRHEGKDHLVWRVQLTRIDGDADPTRPVLFIDAHSGEVVWQYENLQTAATTGTGVGYYSGSVSINTYQSGTTYYLEDTTRKLGTYTYNSGTTSASYCTDTDGTFNTSSSTAKSNQYIWVEAHYNAGKVWDYYYYELGRNGIDGSGGPGYVSSLTGSGATITSFVNYSSRYANAFWDGSAMYYGDGDGTWFYPLVTLDISGHELTHGVTENESNLTYSGESGGLNESMSDIFGAAIEAYRDGAVSSDTWDIGEEAYIPTGALRYMDDPYADGYSMDYYSSSAASTDVHYSSGISNLAFYLLSQGGTHPRGKSTTSVTGIGIDAAAAIFYRANATYMTASTNFSGARTATLSAAADLYGSTSTEYTQVGNAWTAVGVGGSSGGTTTTCTTSTGSLSAKGKSAYISSSSGFTVSSSVTMTGALTGPSSADFDLYLQKKSGSSWTSVASGTTSTSTESVSYSATAGTYRWRVYSYSGSGSYSLYYCK